MGWNSEKLGMFRIFIRMALFVYPILLVSCDNGADCNINNISYNRVLLYGTNGEDSIMDSNCYPDTLTAKLIINGKDSIVINKSVGASELQLPVCYTQECDTIVLEYADDITDTLYIEHTNEPYFISVDCGMAMYHYLNGVRYTKNLIDSVVIAEPFINFDFNENIKLYITE